MGYGINFDEMVRTVARKLGYDPDKLTTLQRSDVERDINNGYRRFLDPPGIKGAKPHKWSFLYKVYEIELAKDVDEYEMPPDFGELYGRVIYSEPHLTRPEIRQVTENEIYLLRQRDVPVSPSPSRYVAIRHDHESTSEVKFILLFWPKPTETLRVQFRYQVFKDIFRGDQQPLGGDVHSATVLAAALAESDRFMEESEGVHEKYFLERLEVSINHDLKNSPEWFGYNRDNSGDRYVPWPSRVVTIKHENDP